MNKELIDKEFIVARGRARHMMLKKYLGPVEKDELSGIFQQATQGDCVDWKVGRTMGTQLLDLSSKNKYTSWVANKGLNEWEAKEKYNMRVKEMAANHLVVFPELKKSPYGSMSSVAYNSS